MVTYRRARLYEIDGRLIVRGLNVTTQGIPTGLGCECEVLDGYPHLAPALIGEVVMRALSQGKIIPHPVRWPGGSSDHALLALAPKRYRSYRSLLRAMRAAGATEIDGQLSVFRLYPDVSSASHGTKPNVSSRGYPRRVALGLDADAEAIGHAFVRVLRQPPLRDLRVVPSGTRDRGRS